MSDRRLYSFPKTKASTCLERTKANVKRRKVANLLLRILSNLLPSIKAAGSCGISAPMARQAKIDPIRYLRFRPDVNNGVDCWRMGKSPPFGERVRQSRWRHHTEVRAGSVRHYVINC